LSLDKWLNSLKGLVEIDLGIGNLNEFTDDLDVTLFLPYVFKNDPVAIEAFFPLLKELNIVYFRKIAQLHESFREVIKPVSLTSNIVPDISDLIEFH
jgi:hypothetical protein